MTHAERVASLDWPDIARRLDSQGFVVLPGLLEQQDFAALRAALYPPLAAIANRWQRLLDPSHTCPASLAEWQARCRNARQHRELSHLHRLRQGEWLGLRQQTEGSVLFALQGSGLLSKPGQDFDGGELILTEQRPRQQSRPIVVPLAQGELALFASRYRPVCGAHGHYRVSTRHAVSRVRHGERWGLDLYFHLAP